MCRAACSPDCHRWPDRPAPTPTGPHDIDFGFDRAFVTVGSGGDPALLAPFKAAGINLASLLMITYTGQITAVADFGAYEAANNPAGGPIDSNAYGLEILATRAVIADAGGNSLLQIDQSLTLSTLAVFPNRMVPGPGGVAGARWSPCPTSIAEGPRRQPLCRRAHRLPVPGRRRPCLPGAGRRRHADDSSRRGSPTSSTSHIGPDGAAYVLEHDVNSLAVRRQRRPADQDRALRPAHRAGRRAARHPGKMTVGPDNAVYVTVNSTSAGDGQVLRITQ